MKISKLFAQEILDSRGNPTICVSIELENGILTKASVPSGASTGIHEAYELRDGDSGRYGGLGVLKAVKNVNKEIAKKLVGYDVVGQRKIDELLIKLDGTKNKKKLGANAILGVSLACARASALVQSKELYRSLAIEFGFSSQEKPTQLPVPIFNIFNGGKHADTNLDFQEFHIIVKKAKFSKMLQIGVEIFHTLGEVLFKNGFDTDVGSEGGYAPDIHSSIQAVEMIIAAIRNAGYAPGRDVYLGMDVGSSVLYDTHKQKYIFKLDRGMYTNSTLVGLYHEWFEKYPFILIEDGVAEDDWKGWKELTKELGDELVLVGDDLFCTNIERLEKGIREGVANAVLVKPNQIGTISETMDFVKMAQSKDYKVVVSHRSGETCDDFIADLAVAVGADFIKAGAPSRGERVAKYNRLLEIEASL